MSEICFFCHQVIDNDDNEKTLTVCQECEERQSKGITIYEIADKPICDNELINEVTKLSNGVYITGNYMVIPDILAPIILGEEDAKIAIKERIGFANKEVFLAVNNPLKNQQTTLDIKDNKDES